MQTLDSGYCYRTYGLKLRSQLPLPELLLDEDAPETLIDVDIRLHRQGQDSVQSQNRVEVTPTTVELSYANVGTFLIRDGQEIVITTSFTVDDTSLRLLLLGPVLAILLHQRGLLVLHASAVVINGLAVAFLGGSGWGKSTTAAAFYQHGYGVVADDLVVVQFNNGVFDVIPGFPRLKLWSEAATYLGEDPETLAPLRPGLDKRGHCVRNGFVQAPIPLHKIYVLTQGEHQAIEHLSPQDAFKELVRHSYLLSLLEGTDAFTTHFMQCGQLPRYVPVCRLIREQALTELPYMTEMVVADLQKQA